MDKIINEEYKQKEIEIQNQINECIENFNNFYFDAGAGAGKTYALQKSIEYILENKTEILVNASQKILCITYTNAAKNEILDRIGNNSHVTVSTIHDFLWSFIGHQQPLLIKEHKRKIEQEIEKIEADLSNISFYDQLEDQEDFARKVSEPEFLDVFYKFYSESASTFRNEIEKTGMINEYDTARILRNVSNFRKVVTSLVNLNECQIALAKISAKEKIKIRYKPTRNRDRLSRFVISHDTLLDYAFSIITNNVLLKRLFSDKYPYVLVDEYQDTHKEVIDIFSDVLNYSKERNKKFLVGYFGDHMQNIYSSGIGKLDDNEDFVPIRKIYNRRSASQIVELIEKIRNDNFGQVSIYKNFDDGHYQFYHCQTELDLSNFVLQKKINSNCACLLLKNEAIAKERKFSNLWNTIRTFPRFNGGNYDNISSEFLTSNLQNMGWFLREIYTFIDFIMKVKNDQSTVRMITNFIDSPQSITYGVFSQLITKVKSINSLKLGDYIEEFCKIKIFRKENIDNPLVIDSILKNVFSIDITGDYTQQIKNRAYDYFHFTSTNNVDEESEPEKDINRMTSFFELNIEEFFCWYKYIQDDGKERGTNYYTLHNSKGLEFGNVVVVIENQFAKKGDYFQYFFNNYGTSILTGDEQKRFNDVRNLFYVACSRARKKLYVIYLSDELGEKEKKNIESIFGEIFLIEGEKLSEN